MFFLSLSISPSLYNNYRVFVLSATSRTDADGIWVSPFGSCGTFWFGTVSYVLTRMSPSKLIDQWHHFRRYSLVCLRKNVTYIVPGT